MNFAARIAETAGRFPQQIAIERVGAEAAHATTYAELLADGGRWSAWLTAQGISRGDRVAILGDNDASWIAAYLGVLRIGAIAVPMDTAYRPAQIADDPRPLFGSLAVRRSRAMSARQRRRSG